MPASVRTNKASAAKGGKNTKDSKSAMALDFFDPATQPSQSSDDGTMATIAQQMQASMEKKKKEKEARFIQAAQARLSKTLSEKAHEFADGVEELDKIFFDFQDAYARNEDNIRKLWDRILEEQLKLHSLVEEKRKLTVERENRREQEHIQSLAHARKACEDFQRLIDSLHPHFEVA